MCIAKAIKQEPLFGCCQCYDEFSWPARDLRIIDGDLWCENCWSQADFEPALDFKEYPAFVPDYDKKIKVLETALRECLDFLKERGDDTWSIDLEDIARKALEFSGGQQA
jgi:hypothetical protein